MKKLCLVAHERTCEESQVTKTIKTNSSRRSISYQFAHNKSKKYCNKKKKKLKILLKTLDKQNSTCYNTYKNYYVINKVTTKRTKM